MALYTAVVVVKIVVLVDSVEILEPAKGPSYGNLRDRKCEVVKGELRRRRGGICVLGDRKLSSGTVASFPRRRALLCGVMV